MPIKFTTGQTISLKKEAPGLKTLLFGLGWDQAEKTGLSHLFKSDFDLDSSIICLDGEGKLKKATDVVYYAAPKHPSEAITHLGDELTGAGDETKEKVLVENHAQSKGHGDKEQILVTLSQIPEEIAKLVFFVNIYEAKSRRQTFGQVRNAYVHLVDLEDEIEIARYELSHEFYRDHTAILLAEIYRDQGKWQLHLVGEGLKIESLQAFVDRYS